MKVKLFPFMIVMLLSLLTDLGSAQDEFPVLSGPYLGQNPPGLKPELFAPGILPVDGIQHCFPAFSPDGREVYWMKFDSETRQAAIYFTQEVDGIWTEPQISPFSGEHNDMYPVFSHDGNRLYFISGRPGGYGRGDIWYMDRENAGWSEPENLGSPPNTEKSESQITITETGTIYYVRPLEGAQWNSGIYRSRFIDGKYMEPEPLSGAINTEHADSYPYIAADESYLLFGSSRPGANSVETDLYITVRGEDDSWSEPVHLDSTVNNGYTVTFPFVTYDGRFLFINRFDESKTDVFFWVDASILEQYRK